jgi:peptide methionine sulfoxide reductase MsrA
VQQASRESACAVVIAAAQPALADITPVYFGNGCFWGRQKDFVDTEMKLGRTVASSTAVVGYAGGQENTKAVCYYYNAPDTLYEKQVHAEVVQVGLDSDKASEQFAGFAEIYFSQFKRTPRGMLRLVRAIHPPLRSPDW